MSDTCCPFIKPDGAPCAAHPLPNSDFCLFHDPAHQQALAESRSKGGSTPRRRTRRFPRLLDHVHVAHLLRVYPPLAPEVEALLEAEPNPRSEPLNAPAPAPLPPLLPPPPHPPFRPASERLNRTANTP